MLTFQLAESGPRPLEALDKCTPHTHSPSPAWDCLSPCGAHPARQNPVQGGTDHGSHSISRVQPQIHCARADQLRRWGWGEREGCFPEVMG